MWYLTTDESLIGPIEIGEIEARWGSLACDKSLLAWKPGMEDWKAIPEVPELSHLANSLPAPAPAMAPAAETAADFGWTPSAASSLMALAQQELGETTKGEAPGLAPEAGLPDFSAGGLFAPGAASTSPSTSLAPAFFKSDPFASGPVTWTSTVALRPRNQVSAMCVLSGGMAAVIVVCMAGLLFALRADTAATRLAANPPVQSRGFQTAATLSLQPLVNPLPVVETAQTANSAVLPKESPEEPAILSRPMPRPRPRPAVKAVAGIPVAALLTKNDIVSGVKTQVRGLGSCLTKARNAGEVAPGKITFVLDWTINPDGSTANPKLKMPADVLSTSLPGCFAQQMRRWEFPASAQGAPVKNFPVPVKLL